MGLRITTLSENTAGRDNLLAEWGLSVLIEADGVNILFDTGQSLSATYNADRLGIDLSKIDKVVLSHGHYDHTGGLRPLLMKIGKTVEVVAHPDIWAAKYRRRQGEADRYIGIPFSRAELESLGARFNLTAKPVQLTDNIITTGEIPMVTGFEELGSNLFVKVNGGWQPDELLDDQALIIKTELGLAVILGCAHRGLINTLYHAQKVTGVKKIHAVLGGSHLTNTTEERVWATIAALKDFGVQRLGLCHCTGLAATVIVAREFGENFIFNNTGTVINLP
jgi:7,8-dihydropterin-6-yl-methyl-4-(beta-D-ribofuranosyl)aminobenzene 5'-phosphate synthase